MAGVVATQMSALRTALQAAPASLVNIPDTFRMDDLPAGKTHKTFRLKEIESADLAGIYGGSGANSLVEYFGELQLEIHWDPQVGGDTTLNTIADDLENVNAVMLKLGNRTAGVLQILPRIRFKVEPKSVNEIVAIGTFSVRFRVAQDLT